MKARKHAWLISPWADFSFFIAAPLAIVPTFHLLTAVFPPNALKLAILSVSATGHHLPGFIRAYTDKQIFSQFRWRLLVIPSLLILLSLAAAYFKLTVVFFILIVWSTWHGSMQILGFLRIYDVKAGFMSRATARLDFWMCLTWFVQVVLWSAPKKISVLSSFYLAGGPLLPLKWARAFETGWLAWTLGVTAAYAVQSALDWRRHQYLNVPKLLCLVSSFAFWAYCMITVNSLILGLILWEIFHDLQYNAFVWNYNRNRVDRNLSQSRIENFLFRLDWKKLSLYAACILAYGALGLLSQDVLNVYENGEPYGTLLSQIGNVFAASAMIHFYLDGFIWKVRDGKVRRDLGVTSPDTYRPRPKALHLALVSFFFAAAACLGLSEYFHWSGSQARRQADNLAEWVPRSGYANFVKASALQAEGRADSAILYYERAMRFDTNYNLAHAFIADLKFKTGDTVGAITNLEAAINQDAEDADARETLAGLYVQTGRYEKARGEYTVLLASDSLNAGYAYQLGWSLLQMKRGREAKPYLEKSLALNPRQPRALNYLGMIEQAFGNAPRARELYRKSLALDSTYAHARENLSTMGD